MKYKRQAKGYVWCDFHGEIHESRSDFYESHEDDCGGLNFRRVYVETNDTDEVFE